MARSTGHRTAAEVLAADTLYNVLGVAETATAAEIRCAHLRSSLLSTPSCASVESGKRTTGYAGNSTPTTAATLTRPLRWLASTTRETRS